MLLMLKRLRVGLATSVLVLAMGGSAMAATTTGAIASASPSSDLIDLQAPDCYATCTKTLAPGQRLVVGVQYARSLEQVSGLADGFGARFVVERSTDGTNWTKVLETAGFQNGFSQALSSAVSPGSFPAYYKVAAVNDATWLLSTRGTLSLHTN
jgi:hypothetical protein